MNIAEHVTFDQLPQAKCLLTIATMSASLRTGNSRRQSGRPWLLLPADSGTNQPLHPLLAVTSAPSRTNYVHG